MVVTIDGPGGVGKSTVAKLLAQRLGLTYLDTGATYRALALAARRERLLGDVEAIAALARRLPVRIEPVNGGGLRVRLGREDVSQEIRTEGVSEAAAIVSQYPEVRSAMVQLQRRLANQQSVVVEGRDTGTVVFPRATYKFFLNANPAVRARRRQRELQKRYGSGVSLAEVREQLEFRDELDSTRRVGPLKCPRGATVIDTSRLSTADVVQRMLRRVERARPPQ